MQEPRLEISVHTHMRVITHLMVITVLGFSGCATTPLTAPVQVPPWPASVARTCPQRTILLECFRSSSIRHAMKGLVQRLQACHRPDMESTLVKLTIETRGGAPSCVQHSRLNNQLADCLAKTVARSLVIPDSPKSERCHFRYPILFEGRQP